MYIAELATGVLVAYLTKNAVESSQLPTIVADVTSALNQLRHQNLPNMGASQLGTDVVPPKQSTEISAEE
jgi:predicted transcriptional regulator